jgi:hypothetical protein
MLIASVPTVAFPLSVIAHDVRPGAVALPDAVQAMVVGLLKAPCAVPVSLRSPAHVALNEPRADVTVCSATVHTKLVQVLGDGMIVDEVHEPSSELFPAAVGDVNELSRSKLVQPDAAAAAIDNTTRKARFFI